MYSRILALFLTALGASAASESLEFTAYILSDNQHLFMISDRAEGRSSSWLKAGDSFGGYTVDRFEPKDETLTVKKAARSFTLPLKQGKVQQRSDKAPLLTYRLNSEGKIGDMETFKQLLRSVAGNPPRVQVELQFGLEAKVTQYGTLAREVYEVAKELKIELVSMQTVAR